MEKNPLTPPKVPTTDPFFKTTPGDFKHYPATNQAHYCWQRYNEYVLCLRKTGSDEDKCAGARHLANCICPGFWMEEWDEQREAGKFLGVSMNKK